jgi:HD superfamily phosphohydrolase YqeK
MAGNGFRTCLFIGSDYESLKGLRTLRAPRALKPDILHEEAELESALLTPGPAYPLIVLSADNVWPPLVELIYRARKAAPAAAIYLSYRETPPFSPVEITRLGLQGTIRRDRWIPELLQPLVESPLASRLAEIPAGAPEAGEPGFHTVPIGELAACAPSIFDIYLRLSPEKSVKLLNARDALDADRIGKLLDGGVRHVLVPASGVRRCLGYQWRFANKILVAAGASMETKLLHFSSLTRAFEPVLRAPHLGPKEYDSAVDLTVQALRMIKQANAARVDFLPLLLASRSRLTHAALVTLISGLLLEPLGISNDSLRMNFALAAVLHDVALYRGSGQAWPERGPELSSEPARAELQAHPATGAELLAESFPTLDPIILQAVAQHHERRDGRGYPNRLGTGEMVTFAEMIGVADELAWELQSKERPDLPTALARLDKRDVLDGYSAAVVNAFRAVFGAPPNS